MHKKCPCDHRIIQIGIQSAFWPQLTGFYFAGKVEEMEAQGEILPIEEEQGITVPYFHRQGHCAS